MNSEKTNGVEDPHQLLLQYLDGTLDDEGVRRLNQKLSSDPALIREAADTILLELQLFEIGQAQKSEGVAGVTPQPTGSVWLVWLGALQDAVGSRLRWAAVAGSAAVLGLAGFAIWQLWSNEPRLVATDGPVVLVRQGHESMATAGASLQMGDQLILREGAAASIGYGSEATLVRLTDSAKVRLETDKQAKGKRLRLDNGTIDVSAARQPAGAPLRIVTAQAEARVLGTQFLLSTDPRATQIQVWSGSVQLIRQRDGISVTVEHGHSASVGDGPEMIARPIKQGVLMECWRELPGSRVTDLTSLASFPARPNEAHSIDQLELASPIGDFYGLRLRGWLRPPRSGDYTFWIAADDEGELWLSRDEAPAAKERICRTVQLQTRHEWDKSPEQQSRTIHLIGGRRYYVEVLMKQAGGSEFLAVAWKGPGIDRQIINQEHLGATPESTNP